MGIKSPSQSVGRTGTVDGGFAKDAKAGPSNRAQALGEEIAERCWAHKPSVDGSPRSKVVAVSGGKAVQYCCCCSVSIVLCGSSLGPSLLFASPSSGVGSGDLKEMSSSAAEVESSESTSCCFEGRSDHEDKLDEEGDGGIRQCSPSNGSSARISSQVSTCGGGGGFRIECNISAAVAWVTEFGAFAKRSWCNLRSYHHGFQTNLQENECGQATSFPGPEARLLSLRLPARSSSDEPEFLTEP